MQQPHLSSMAASHLLPSPSFSIFRPKTKSSLPPVQFQYPKLSRLSHSLSCQISSSSSLHCNAARKTLSLFADVDDEQGVMEETFSEEDVKENDEYDELKKKIRPCELYVCNLPRSSDISELLEMFKPFGTVISVEVSRNPDTGVSRGCGYVTMSSVESAHQAILALDGKVVGGREILVRFSVDMSSGTRNPLLLNSSPIKVLYYESPHRLFVGNLALITKPEELKNHFSQFGTVTSAKVFYDRKSGKNRAYGFVSFSSPAERDAALSLNGSEFLYRILVVKRVDQ